MKPFSLEEYLKNPNRKVVTRDGRRARIICTDAKCEYPLVALITICDEDDVYEIIESYTKDGCCSYGQQDSIDLCFAPEKHEGWVNLYHSSTWNEIYPSKVFASEEEAKHNAGESIATIKVEWEE